MLMPGKLLRAENAVFLKAGEIRKRNGYVALAQDILSSTTISSGQRLASLGSELLLLSHGELFSWASGTQKWIDKGTLSPVTLATSPVVRNSYQQSNPDMALANGTVVYAWTDARGGVWAGIFDDATGAALLPEQQLHASGSNARCIAIGLNLVVLYLVTTGGVTSLRTRTVPLSNPSTFSAEKTLLVDGNITAANQHLDVCASAFSNAAAFAYNALGGNVRIGYVLSDGSLGSVLNGGVPAAISLAESADSSIAIVEETTTGDLYVLYSNTVATRMAAFTGATLAAKFAAKNIEALATVVNVTGVFDASDHLQTFYEVTAASPGNHVIRVASWTPAGAAINAPADLRRSVGLGGKAFLHIDSGVHVIGVHDSTVGAVEGFQNTYFLFHVSGRIEARMQPGQAGKIQSNQIPSVVAKDAADFYTIFQQRTKFVTEGNTSYSLLGITRETITFGGGAYRTVEFGAALLIAGGVVGEYDGGLSVIENGFHLYPENVTVAVTGGGVALEIGVRQIMFCWEWVDNKGQEHRSTPSVPLSFETTLIGETATFTVPTLRLTDKRAPRTNVVLAAYCTEAGGDIFYKIPNSPATDPQASPVYNDPTVDTVTFVRTIADVDILDFEVVYTQGNILGNDAAQAAAQIFVSQNRAFLLSAENRRRFYYSKKFQIGEAPAFSDYLYVDVDPNGGDVTAGFIMDSNVVIFKERQIEIMSGDGPDDGGNNDTFSSPVLVTTDVGCINPDSIALVPDGLVFQSNKGMYHLSRSLSVTYKGAPVEDYTLGIDITSATLVEAASEVRFTTSAGPTLVWNYFFDLWSVFTQQPAVHAFVWPEAGAFTYVTAAGKVLVETDGYFLDDDQAIHMLLETAWIKLAGLQGVQRVRSATFLGEFFQNHLMEVQIAHNYQDYSQEWHPWDTSLAMNQDVFGVDTPFGSPIGDPFGGVGESVYQFKVPLKRQKCQSVRFLIQDLGSSVGQAYSMTAIALEVAKKEGSFRVPASKIAGSR